MSIKNENLRNTVLVGCLAAVLLGTAYWVRHKPSAADTGNAADGASNEIKAPAVSVGSLFKPNETLACNTPQMLQDTLAAAMAKDRVKFAAGFKSHACIKTDSLATYKTLALSGEMVQFVPTAGDTSTSMWMLQDAVKELVK